MCRENSREKSSQEKVASADENLLIYCKPIRLYNILHLRWLCNPFLLQRCLSYMIRTKGETKSNSNGTVFFNYKDCNNTLQKIEVGENCSCPFCPMACGSFKGLQHHLNSFHKLFEFEFMILDEKQIVNISVKNGAFGFEERSNVDTFEPFSFCSKPRKRRQKDGNTVRRVNVRFMELDLPDLTNDAENGNALLNDGNGGLGQFGTTNNSSTAISHSSLDSNGRAMLASEAVVPAIKKRKLSTTQSEAKNLLHLPSRQFYHSHRFQPMALEQVMSDRDSEDEVDDDVADFEDRQMLKDFVDVSEDEKKMMHMWNTFIRKQRIVADGHITWTCEAFSKFHKKDLLNSSRLLGTWRVFMIKLWNHGLLDAATMNKCNIILENRPKKSENKNKNTVPENLPENSENTNNNTIPESGLENSDNTINVIIPESIHENSDNNNINTIPESGPKNADNNSNTIPESGPENADNIIILENRPENSDNINNIIIPENRPENSDNNINIIPESGLENADNINNNTIPENRPENSDNNNINTIPKSGSENADNINNNTIPESELENSDNTNNSTILESRPENSDNNNTILGSGPENTDNINNNTILESGPENSGNTNNNGVDLNNDINNDIDDMDIDN